MKRKNGLRKNQGGFVIIVALGMVMIAIILMAILQSGTLKNIERIADYENLSHAEAFVDSGMEILQFKLKKEGSTGYLMGKTTCTYGDSVAENAEGGGYSDICQDFDLLVDILNEGGKTNNVKVEAEIKGRASDGSSKTVKEAFSCSTPEFPVSSSCYVVPFPGTGSAGKNCEMYKPDFAAGAKGNINFKTGKLESSSTQNQGELVQQIDYACNWNKLQFGSSVIDRATIPLYYTKDDGETVSPFSDDTTIGGIEPNPYNFVVRVRTPCKPVTNTATKKTVTPTDCKDADRYILNEKDGDDIVVQWQITGQCKKSASSTEYDEECGMIQFPEYENKNQIAKYFSAISEGRINYLGSKLHHPDDTAHKVLYGILRTIDTSNYGSLEHVYISQKPPKASGMTKLPTMKNPTLTLFLSNKLIDEYDKYVPYLEYQVLTDTPISDSRIRMTVSVNFNGNNYKKTIYKEEQKPLIDFAIQN
ncbi:hypothetical protein HY604_01185 [Candidatus Peregrinibacteria bacterium]|nr:hypothetical protein [Candidatus Peregrinibacteria bacterium]